MPQSLAKVLLHIVFSTKDRRPFLADDTVRDEMHRYLGGCLAQLDCPPVIVGGVEDHVHLLASLSRTLSIADLVKETKRASSLWIKDRSEALGDFAWQNGYGAFSIGASQTARVRRYVAEQREHHRRQTFQDEFRTLLTRYRIEYDERYVWE